MTRPTREDHSRSLRRSSWMMCRLCSAWNLFLMMVWWVVSVASGAAVSHCAGPYVVGEEG